MCTSGNDTTTTNKQNTMLTTIKTTSRNEMGKWRNGSQITLQSSEQVTVGRIQTLGEHQKITSHPNNKHTLFVITWYSFSLLLLL